MNMVHLSSDSYAYKEVGCVRELIVSGSDVIHESGCIFRGVFMGPISFVPHHNIDVRYVRILIIAGIAVLVIVEMP